MLGLGSHAQLSIALGPGLDHQVDLLGPLKSQGGAVTGGLDDDLMTSNPLHPPFKTPPIPLGGRSGKQGGVPVRTGAHLPGSVRIQVTQGLARGVLFVAGTERTTLVEWRMVVGPATAGQGLLPHVLGAPRPLRGEDHPFLGGRVLTQMGHRVSFSRVFEPAVPGRTWP